MSKARTAFGLIETFSPHPDNVECADDKCGRLVQFMEKCLIDGTVGDIFCAPCGECLRYERKMAARRKEAGIPERRIIGE